MNHYIPIIIIGAPRSGTNMLRDIISAQPSFATWPCDEINYIWRYGNSRFPYDEIGLDRLTPKIEKYIKRQFHIISRRYDSKYVVEKTCANCLRLEFVDAIFPQAFYINIIRDGRDAAASALKRWQAPLDIPYILKKARFVPAADIPYYAGRYVATHIHRLFFSKEKSLPIWGPKFLGYEAIVKERSLIEVCAVQWQKCVQKSRAVFEKRIAPERYLQVRYEDFVCDPGNQTQQVFDYFKLSCDKDILQQHCKRVRQDRIGKWKEDLSPDQQKLLYKLLNEDLKKFKYI